MNIFNSAITELQGLLLIQQENQQTYSCLKQNRKKMYLPISSLALIPQQVISQDPIVHIGGDYFAQVPYNEALISIKEKIDMVSQQIEKLKFKYFPEAYLTKQQQQQINQELNNCLSKEIPGFMITQGYKSIQITEKTQQNQFQKNQKISKFALQHNLK